MCGGSPIRCRWWLLVGGLVGFTAATVAPVAGGCVYHDTCIMVTSPGNDWCRNVALAKMWPVGGSFEDAEPVLRADGAAPRGCRCYNDAEDQVFDDEAPECQYQGFLDDLAQAAREECQALVPAGGNTSGGLLEDIDSFVDCEGQDCEINEGFARRLYTDPSPLLDQRTRLVYDSKLRRHVLSDVESGSLAHALGLRTGDVLESVDGTTVRDLDAALQVYGQLGDATAVDVRVRRGTRWLDFTYTFVP